MVGRVGWLSDWLLPLIFDRFQEEILMGIKEIDTIKTIIDSSLNDCCWRIRKCVPSVRLAGKRLPPSPTTARITFSGQNHSLIVIIHGYYPTIIDELDKVFIGQCTQRHNVRSWCFKNNLFHMLVILTKKAEMSSTSAFS